MFDVLAERGTADAERMRENAARLSAASLGSLWVSVRGSWIVIPCPTSNYMPVTLAPSVRVPVRRCGCASGRLCAISRRRIVDQAEACARSLVMLIG